MGLYVCCWRFTHFCHCAMACCSQLPTLLSPAPHAAQLIRALSLSWSPALIPIPRRGRSNCHKTPTALDTKSTHTHTHTHWYELQWKSFLNFLHLGMGDHFWVRCGVFPFFVVVFFGIFCRLMRREGRRRKWVIYIFDELSLLNATNQTRLPSFQLPWGQEAMPGKVFVYYKINIIYLCDSWQTTWLRFCLSVAFSKYK